MKKILFISISFVLSLTLFAQKPGYYNGSENKKGDDLKTALHNIINNHVDFSYSDSKYILNYADEDPDNTNNLIQFYTNRSVSKDDYGTGGDLTNREHIWAKSHGAFADIRPMDGDAHNLHAADASVNVIRSNKDFDNAEGGTYIEEADAYYSADAFEPADRDKGAVARTLFYMATRYEGTNGEMDLKMVDYLNSADPNSAEHGKLSTLLEWNNSFPPSEMERRRNERVYQSQLNRNPFIDNPEFANLIWGDAELAATSIENLSMTPLNPNAGETVTINASLINSSTDVTAKLYWGKQYNSETYVQDFTGTENLTTQFSLENFAANEMVFLKIVASTGEVSHASFCLAPSVTLTTISDVQGTGNASPIENTVVTVSGIVTANFDNSFYIQSSNSNRSGICVYSIWRGNIGDSVAVTGKVVEYQQLTEISDVTMVYNYGQQDTVKPLDVTIADLDEDLECMVIKLNDVNFSNADELIPTDGGTYNINEGNLTIPVYVRYNSRLIGNKIPNGTVSVTAILSQYKDNYQLLIDNIGWIEQGVDVTAPIINSVTVTSESLIEVSFNEKIEESTVIASAFSIEGVTIDAAYFYPSTKVYLSVSGLQKKEYTLTVNGIEDLYGNVIENGTFNFTSEFGTGISENTLNAIGLYPNPSNGQFTIRFNENLKQNTILTITDLSGRILLNQIIESGTKNYPVNIENLAKGNYLLQFEINNTLITKRAIVN